MNIRILESSFEFSGTIDSKNLSDALRGCCGHACYERKSAQGGGKVIMAFLLEAQRNVYQELKPFFDLA
jgi:hypothetical protein